MKRKRKIPQLPNFNNNAANKIEPKVGASTCASGSQIWNGKIGILIAKTINNKNQISNCFSLSNFCEAKAKKFVVCNSKYKINKAENKKSDPNKV